jgi:inorganic phosphate transporter, PiT family
MVMVLEGNPAQVTFPTRPGAGGPPPAVATIGAADIFGLPVSLTHGLASGVAGTLASSGVGLQWSTVPGIALAWVLTLAAAILLSGPLYFVLRQVF